MIQCYTLLRSLCCLIQICLQCSLRENRSRHILLKHIREIIGLLVLLFISFMSQQGFPRVHTYTRSFLQLILITFSLPFPWPADKVGRPASGTAATFSLHPLALPLWRAALKGASNLSYDTITMYTDWQSQVGYHASWDHRGYLGYHRYFPRERRLMHQYGRRSSPSYEQPMDETPCEEVQCDLQWDKLHAHSLQDHRKSSQSHRAYPRVLDLIPGAITQAMGFLPRRMSRYG